jgi:DNA processing protein
MSKLQANRELTLLLTQVKGLGCVTFKNLLEEYKDIESIYSFIKSSKKFTLSNAEKSSFEKVKQDLEKFKINYKCIWEDDYPLNLKQIPDPPIILFYIGNFDLARISNSISIVGTRNLSQYGKKFARKFSIDLTLKGFSIISGMAIGIDREAHLACIESQGYTVAVLPTSVEEVVPASNQLVYDKILDNNGLILSEFPPGVIIAPGLFPNRNRIVAGLSLGTLVIEAGYKSGALITARLAQDYNKEVFTIPGNIDSKESIGCNKLIKENKAKLIVDVSDILVEFGYKIEEAQINKTNLNVLNLAGLEKVVYNALISKAKFIEELSIILKIDITELSSVCSLMELRAIICKGDDGRYYIN